MANTKAKLISDIRQAFISQATKHSNSTTAPVSSAITELSANLGTTIANYVDFVPVFMQSQIVGNTSSQLVWLTTGLNTLNNQVFRLDTNSSTTPTGTSILPATTYTQTINVSTGGSGNLDCKVYLNRAPMYQGTTPDWVVIARTQIYNSLFAIIPSGYQWAVSFENSSTAQANIFVTICKAGK